MNLPVAVQRFITQEQDMNPPHCGIKVAIASLIIALYIAKHSYKFEFRAFSSPLLFFLPLFSPLVSLPLGNFMPLHLPLGNCMPLHLPLGNFMPIHPSFQTFCRGGLDSSRTSPPFSEHRELQQSAESRSLATQGGYNKITCGAFLLSQQLFPPLTLYGNLNLPFHQFICSLADLGAELDRPSKTVPKKF